MTRKRPQRSKPIKALKKKAKETVEIIDDVVDMEDAPKKGKKLVEDKDLEKHMTPRQILFCKYFVNDEEVFYNGTRSYAKAYNVNLELEPKKYNACKSNAQKLLTNTYIARYMHTLLEEILPDSGLDKELTKLIIQDQDLGVKVKAIGLMNKLRGRIIEKQETVERENWLENLNSKVKESKKKKKK